VLQPSESRADRRGSAALVESRSPGKERDTETGLDYFGARYYGSTMGRWLSPDWSRRAEPVPYARLENPQTLNLYSLLENNPVNSIDADGHEVDLTNKDEQLRAQTLKRILSNVNKNERGLFTTVTGKDGKVRVVLDKDAAAAFSGQHSAGFSMLSQAIDAKAVASVEINDHPTMPDGSTINTGPDAGGGRTVPSGNGRDVNVYLSSNGDQSGIPLYGTRRQVIPNPVGIIMGHELFGHARMFMLGMRNWNFETGPDHNHPGAVDIENILRREQGLPLRGGGYN
jgi:RHS repeat-associated protein